ncbi:MAG: arginine decarboxylase, partial [Dokdonella sp.]
MSEQRWNAEAARHTWAVPHWSEGYFDVGDNGDLLVRPQGPSGPTLSLPALVEAARGKGSRLPLLVRFADILNDRRARLQRAFAKAMTEWDYAGGYTAIYPIKVNQQKNVAGELAANGGDGFGLEAGSKPELMAVLALARKGSTVICNGYKDREYIRLALIGSRLGLDIFIVIEKPSELLYVIEEAKVLGVEPLLGVRMRLKSLGAGKWQNSGGDKAKFGLTP